MWQTLTVCCIVAAAAFNAGSKYLPSGWRQRVVFLLAQRGASQARMAAWFNTASSCGSGCSSCSAKAPCSPAPLETSSARRVIKLHVQ